MRANEIESEGDLVVGGYAIGADAERASVDLNKVLNEKKNLMNTRPPRLLPLAFALVN